MKKYKLYELDYYSGFRKFHMVDLPPEFTYDELKEYNDCVFESGKYKAFNLAEYKLKRIKNARKHTVIEIRCSSRNCDIVIVCLGEDNELEICKKRETLEKNKDRRVEIYEELYRTSKELIGEQKVLEKETVKLKAYIKDFDEGTVFKRNKKGGIKSVSS